MKEKARDLMVRDKFIASQQSCDLRRHLDGAASETSILDNNTPDPGGGRRLPWKQQKDDTHGPRWTPDVQGFPVLGSLTPAEKDRRDRAA